MAYFAVKVKVTNSVTDQKEIKNVGVKADDIDAAYAQLVNDGEMCKEFVKVVRDVIQSRKELQDFVETEMDLVRAL